MTNGNFYRDVFLEGIKCRNEWKRWIEVYSCDNFKDTKMSKFQYISNFQSSMYRFRIFSLFSKIVRKIWDSLRCCPQEGSTRWSDERHPHPNGKCLTQGDIRPRLYSFERPSTRHNGSYIEGEVDCRISGRGPRRLQGFRIFGQKVPETVPKASF